MARTQQQNTFFIHSRQLQGASTPPAGVYVGLRCESNGINSNGHTDNGIDSEKKLDHVYTDSGRAATTSVVSMCNLSVIDLDDEVLQANPRFSPEFRMEPSAGIQVESTRKSGTWMGAWQIEARSLAADTARFCVSGLSRLENWVYIFVTAMIMVGVIYGVALAMWLCTVGGEGASLALQINLNSWKSRVVYHALTDRFARSNESNGENQQCGILYDYCGGTYRGMEERLNYIRSMGFDAIMISPIPENVPYGYHGYWMKNLESLNPKFGTSADLKGLVDSAHRKNMLVMLDVVSNHVGCPGGGGPCGDSSVAPWKSVSPFSKRADYHPFCTVDFYRYNASNWQHCWLAGLPDLDHDNPRVRRAFKLWIKRTVRTFGFDGVRIDAGHLMKPDFVLEMREASGVFGIAEFLVQVPTYQQRTQITAQIQDYATGAFLQTFQVACDWAFLHRRPLLELAEQLEYLYAATENPELNAIYLDNHDLERFYGRANDTMLLKNALVITLLSRGVPFVYYGTEQGYQGMKDPQNRESLWPNYDEDADIYKFIQRVLAFRSGVALYDWPEQITRHADTQSYAFSRGQTLVVVTNAGSTRPPSHQEWRLQSHSYKPHQVLCNILTTGDCLMVGAEGEIDIHLMNGEAKVYHPTQ